MVCGVDDGISGVFGCLRGDDVYVVGGVFIRARRVLGWEYAS